MERTNPSANPAAGRERRPTPEFISAFKTLRHPLMLGHVTPDADSLGACLALAAACGENGIASAVGLPAGCVSERLGFMLDLAGSIPRVEHTLHDSFDAAVVIDAASEKRINCGAAITIPGGTPAFNIDHHITNTDFARHNWVDPHASSSCEMIARLIGELGWRTSSIVASLLYSGLHGDTAGFSLPSTTAECLQVAADLVRAGADVSHIGEQLCRSQGRHDFELLRRVYDHTTVTPDGRIAYSYLSHDDIRESGCKAEDIDDQVSIPRALKGVAIAMLFSEGEPGTIRINFRGEGRITVVELAQKFGGGGHSQSAGVRIRNKPMREVIDLVVSAAQIHLKSSSP